MGPKEDYYSQFEYKPDKGRKAARESGGGRTGSAAPGMASRVAVILAIIISFGTLIVVSIFYPDLLGAGWLSKSSAAKTEISLKGGEYYAAQLGAFNTEQEAKDFADTIKAKGAAGYIRYDGVYRVLAACYLARADCEKVLTDPSVSVYDAHMYVISLPGKTLKFSGTAEKGAELSKLMENTCAAAETLYAAFIDLDGGRITAAQAGYKVISLSTSLKSKKAELQQLCKDETALAYARLLSHFEICLNTLDNLAAKPAAEFSSGIKSAEIDILFSYRDTLSEI